VDVHDDGCVLGRSLGLVEERQYLPPVERRVPDNLGAPEGAWRYPSGRGAGKASGFPVGEVDDQHVRVTVGARKGKGEPLSVRGELKAAYDALRHLRLWNAPPVTAKEHEVRVALEVAAHGEPAPVLGDLDLFYVPVVGGEVLYLQRREIQAREAQEVPVPIRSEEDALTVRRHACTPEACLSLVRGQERRLAAREVEPVEVVVQVRVVAGDDEKGSVRRPGGDGVVTRSLPHRLRLPVRGEAAEIVNRFGRPRQVPLLPAPQEEELRTFVAADVHAVEEFILRGRVVDARYPLLVEGKLLRPATLYRQP